MPNADRTRAPRRARAAAAGLLAAAGLAVGACGSTVAAGPLTVVDASMLRHDVQSVRLAAGEDKPAVAHRALATLTTALGRLRESGRIAPTDAARLLLVAAHADARVTAEVHPRATPTTSTTTAVTHPAATPPAKPTPPGPAVGGPPPKHGHGHAAGHLPKHGHGGPVTGDGGQGNGGD